MRDACQKAMEFAATLRVGRLSTELKSWDRVPERRAITLTIVKA